MWSWGECLLSVSPHRHTVWICALGCAFGVPIEIIRGQCLLCFFVGFFCGWVGGGGGGVVLFRNDAVTPRRVALTCVQRVVKFCHTSSHARHDRRTILSRFANVLHVGERSITPWLVPTREAAKKFWTCTKLFSPVSVWVACEPGHVVARPRYVRRALVTRLTSFSDVPHSLPTR